MNLIEEEKILIKDIFNVLVQKPKGQSTNLPVLQDFCKTFSVLGNNASLIQNPTYFDSLLMEKLQSPGTDILGYLQDCLGRSHYAIQKPWNQNQTAQRFIKYSIQIVKNFIYLSLLQSQIFSEQLQIDLNASKAPNKNQQVSMKLMTHFQRRGFNMEIFETVYPRISEDQQGDFIQSFLEVLIARQRFQTILDSKAFFYMNVLQNLCNNANIKYKFFHLVKAPFLPVQFKKVTGSMLDIQSPFGLFAKLSILGYQPGFFHQQIEAYQKFQERMMSEFGKSKFGKQKLKTYSNLQNELYTKLTDIVKIFLKKDSKQQFLDWLHASVYGNLKKAKLASKLANAQNKDLSHDGLVVNLYMCLLNLTKPILNIQSEKYKNIDPQYFMYNQKALLCNYQKMKQKQHQKITMEIQKDFGTITEFFFLTFELMYVGLAPAQDNFVQYIKQKQELQKQKHKFQNNPLLAQKFNYELENLQSKSIRYYILLLDDIVINPTIKLFDLLMFLLPKWLNFDYNKLIRGKIVGYTAPEIAYYLPEHLLDSIYKFHETNFKFKNFYLQSVGEEHINQIVNLTCLLLSEVGIISNPYIGANFVELLFYFLLQNKTGVMYQVFKSNSVAHRNLTVNLVRFYCDIAVTGSSHQFYSKFKYRFFVNKIFTSIWSHEVYREQLRNISHLDIFQRFINMIMADTTYCFDQTNQKYEQYQKLQRKKQQFGLTQQEQGTAQQMSMQMSSTLQQNTSNLRLMRDLSGWSPQTFLSDASLSTIAPLLNNILHTFVQPTSFIFNRQLISKYKYQREMVFSDLVQIYVNLDIDDRMTSEIVKDTRFYKKDQFSKALQKASNEHYTDISTLEKFEQMIRKLSKTVNEQQDEEIYGQIPQKYLCSIMNTLLKDPVKLPTSGKIADRVYIHKHLLIDERDPFNRAPLKYNEVIEEKELKMQIEAWKKKRLQQLKGANKQQKYGKIKVNKKDEDDSLYGDAKKINYEQEED